MSSVLSEGKITPEGVQKLRDLIGTPLRSRNVFNRTTGYDGILHWCEGIGDGNPLWIDKEYGPKSSVGVNLAPPSYLYTICTSWVQLGLPGVHGFHSGSDWHWVRPIKHNQEVEFIVWIDDVQEKKSAMGGKAVVVYFSTVYFDQDQNVLARCRSYSFRMERSSNRDRGKQDKIEMKKWTPEELKEVEAAYDREVIRGNTPRYWEDVQEGEVLDEVVKGPLCLTDMVAFYAGCMPAPGPAHGLAVADKKRHPNWWYRNPTDGGLEPPVRVHESVEAAASAGLPAPYDIGIQRNAWLIHHLTNWIGDDAFLIQAECQYRAFNFFGDVTTFSGRVTRKYIENGEHRVDLEITGTSQRGVVSTPGKAVVALPSRTAKTTPVQARMNLTIKLDEYLKSIPVTPPKL